MKKIFNVSKIQVSKIPMFGLAVITAIIFSVSLSLTVCSSDEEDDGVVTFTSISAFEKWYSDKKPNTPDTSYNVKLNVSDLGGSYLSTGSVGNIIYTNWFDTNYNKEKTKYVNLDLSGSKITSIPDSAFSICGNLTGITIPNSVTSIGDSAFSGTGISGITIPDSVISIGTNAFSSCENITVVTIGKSVTGINGSFYGCKNLAAINVDADNSAYSSEDGVLYDKNKTNLLQYPGGKTGAFTIPNSVTGIYKGDVSTHGAFESCNNLTGITISNNVSGFISFSYCTSLASVTFAPTSTNKVTGIDFSSCTSIESITIPDNITSIHFSGCTSLVSFNIPTSLTGIGDNAFTNCNSLTSVSIPTNIKSIGNLAFYTCNKLTTVIFEGTINQTSFSTTAFQGDLRDKYLSKGIGTYTRSGNGSTSLPYTWTKSS